jgi:hypothetical protein
MRVAASTPTRLPVIFATTSATRVALVLWRPAGVRRPVEQDHATLAPAGLGIGFVAMVGG